MESFVDIEGSVWKRMSSNHMTASQKFDFVQTLHVYKTTEFKFNYIQNTLLVPPEDHQYQ